jgi:SAM-dependent methyltransferase
VEQVNCTLCDVDDAVPYAAENGYQAVKCQQCGLIYVSPRPTETEMKRLYDGQETKIDLSAHILRRDVKCSQARAALKVIRRHIPRGRILEIGSAAGYFLFEAKKLGYDVQGLDVTHAFAEFSRSQFEVPVHEGVLLGAPFEPGSFDVVYMRNVLSHLANPREEHNRILELLRPGGILVFETGNAAEMAADEAGELELPDHLHHFGEDTIRRLLSLTGFEVLEVNRFGLIQHLFRRRSTPTPEVTTEASESAKPAPPAPPTELPPSRFWGRLEGAIGTSIRYGVGRVLPKKGRRCTLVVVARRPPVV